MKRILSNTIVLLLPLVLCACVKDIVMDAGENPQVVVECVLTDEPIQTLYLTYSKGASRETAPELPEATATLTDLSESKEIGRFKRTPDGSWTLEYTPVAQHRYRLDVSVPGHDPIWAEQTMPDRPPVESYKLTIEGSYKIPGYEDAIGILYCSTFPCAVWSFGLNYNPITEELVPAEQLCTDYPYVDNSNLTGETYIHEQTFPVTDNQLLRTYSVLSGIASVHRKYLRFPKRESPSQLYFVVEGLSGLNYYEDMSRDPLPTECVLYFAALSDEYDRYLCEAIQYQQLQVSSDITAIYSRTNLYTNIHGGLGVFGAVTKMPIRWSGVYTSEFISQDSTTNNQ